LQKHQRQQDFLQGGAHYLEKAGLFNDQFCTNRLLIKMFN